MGEPFSIAAGGLQLFAFAVKSCSELWDCVDSLKRAPQHVRATLEILEACRSTFDETAELAVQSLQIKYNDGYDKEHPLVKTLKAIDKACQNLKQLVRPYHDGRGVPKTNWRLRFRWFRYKKDIQAQQEKLVRHDERLNKIFNRLIYETTSKMRHEDQRRDLNIQRILGIVEKIVNGQTVTQDERSELGEQLQRHLQHIGSYDSLSKTQPPPSSAPDLPSPSISPPIHEFGNIDAVIRPLPQYQPPSRSAGRLQTEVHIARDPQAEHIQMATDRSQKFEAAYTFAGASGRCDVPLRPPAPIRRNIGVSNTRRTVDPSPLRIPKEGPSLQHVKSEPSVHVAAGYSETFIDPPAASGRRSDRRKHGTRTDRSPVRNENDRRSQAARDASPEHRRDRIPQAPVNENQRRPEGYWRPDQDGNVRWHNFREAPSLRLLSSAPGYLEEQTRGMSEFEQWGYIDGFLRGQDARIAAAMLGCHGTARPNTIVTEDTGRSENVTEAARYPQRTVLEQQPAEVRPSRRNVVHRDPDPLPPEHDNPRNRRDEREFEGSRPVEGHARRSRQILSGISTNHSLRAQTARQNHGPNQGLDEHEGRRYRRDERNRRMPSAPARAVHEDENENARPPFESTRYATIAALKEQDIWASSSGAPGR